MSCAITIFIHSLVFSDNFVHPQEH